MKRRYYDDISDRDARIIRLWSEGDELITIAAKCTL